MGIVFFIIAIFLVYIFSLPMIIYAMCSVASFKQAGEYFFLLAKSLDQFGNAVGEYVFNDLFLTALSEHKYGHEDETISSVTGRNYQAKTLTFVGRGFRWFLDKSLGANHSVESIGERKTKTTK